jgi:hypothetical protein
MIDAQKGIQFMVDSHLAAVRRYAIFTIAANGKLVVFTYTENTSWEGDPPNIGAQFYRPSGGRFGAAIYTSNKKEAEKRLRAIRLKLTAELGQETTDPVRKHLTKASIDALTLMMLTSTAHPVPMRQSQRMSRLDVDDRYTDGPET